MSEDQEIHIVLVSDDPRRVYPALTLILAGKALGINTYLYCTMRGLSLVRKDTINKIVLPEMPPAEKYLKDAIEFGAHVYACVPSKEMLEKMGITEKTLIEGVKIEEAVTFLERALSAAKKGGIILFV